MIDDYASAVELTKRMEIQVPIPAKPSTALLRLLREKGLKIRPEQVLFIKRVFYSGDEGGIMCDITPTKGAKEHYVVSLTHLKIDMGHPLYRDIRAYQQHRVKRLREQDHGF